MARVLLLACASWYAFPLRQRTPSTRSIYRSQNTQLTWKRVAARARSVAICIKSYP